MQLLNIVMSIVSQDIPRTAQVSFAPRVMEILSRLQATAVTLILTLPSQSLMGRSRSKSEFLRRERDVWDQLREQRRLLAHANRSLAEQSAEVADLRLRCADLTEEAVTVRGQVTPLEARVKELEEEVTRVASGDTPCRLRPSERPPLPRPSGRSQIC